MQRFSEELLPCLKLKKHKLVNYRILNKKFNDVKAVYHLSESGELTSCKFSQTKETVSFETTHFSKYIIEYNKTKEKNSEGNNSSLENNSNNNISRNDTNTKANTKNIITLRFTNIMFMII